MKDGHVKCHGCNGQGLVLHVTAGVPFADQPAPKPVACSVCRGIGSLPEKLAWAKKGLDAAERLLEALVRSLLVSREIAAMAEEMANVKNVVGVNVVGIRCGEELIAKHTERMISALAEDRERCEAVIWDHEGPPLPEGDEWRCGYCDRVVHSGHGVHYDGDAYCSPGCVDEVRAALRGDDG